MKKKISSMHWGRAGNNGERPICAERGALGRHPRGLAGSVEGDRQRAGPQKVPALAVAWHGAQAGARAAKARMRQRATLDGACA